MGTLRLRKYHGLGNDYLVLEAGGPVDAALARALCARHRGVGADGVLEPLGPAGDGAFGLRIWNPDGSVAEKSGNGLRIFARWLVDRRGAPADLRVAPPGGVVRCRVDDAAITVEMGRATFDPAAIPAARPLLREAIEVEGARLRVTAVGVGNPHCVVFLDDVAGAGTDLDALPWRAWGRQLERSPLFPNRTNVQFVAVRDRATLEIRIWERGAGETEASGSSACAVAAAAARLGRADREVRVLAPGGALAVRVGEDFALTLRGPVAEVAAVEVEPAVLRRSVGASGSADRLA